MNFNELQVIWDTQQKHPLFAFDQQALHTVVQHKASRIEKYVTSFEWTLIVVPLLMAILLPLDAWFEGGGWDQYVVAAVCLVVGLATLISKVLRTRTDASFEKSIKALAERSLTQVDRHVRRMTWAFWGFHFPVAICAAVGLTVHSNMRTPLIWGAVLAITAVSYWSTRHDTQKKQREKQELEQLLAKLSEADLEADKSHKPLS